MEAIFTWSLKKSLSHVSRRIQKISLRPTPKNYIMAEGSSKEETCLFVVRILGILVGCTLVGYGIAMLFVGSAQNIRGYIANVYLACFGILIILAEVRMDFLVAYFKFLRNGFGLDISYSP
eukprot:jgi/Bigna1/87414/estExt_fgenesh1_pg.C_200060